MRSNQPSKVTANSTKQKVTIVIFVLVLIFLAWQIYGMFGGGTTAEAENAIQPTPINNAPPPPQIAKLSDSAPLSPREQQLLQQQQATEAKYIAALNELQNLKISREIAETNQAISTARLNTVTNEKKIVQMLRPEPIPQTTYSQSLVNPATNEQAEPKESAANTTRNSTEGNDYSVISVIKSHRQWSAVLGFQGKLFNVSVGDALPNGYKVLEITQSGVTLSNQEDKKQISLLPII